MKLRSVHQSEILELPSEIIIENAYDPLHVENVHESTVKSCRVLVEKGNMAILIYTVYVFPKIKILRFLTKDFVVIKEKVKENRVEFLSMPLSLKMASKFVILCDRISDDKTQYNTSFFYRPLSTLSHIVAPLILKLRNRGERNRLKEDMELMRQRVVARKNCHLDRPECAEKEPLAMSWFHEN